MNMETKEGMMEYLKKICERNNYILVKNEQTLNDLVEGLVSNKKKNGYQSCPCRLASGNKKLDRDLMCPCDYAPLDVKEHGACYCNLFMRTDFYETFKTDYIAVPERRPAEKDKAVFEYLKNLHK
ncbi:MAG: ferredoxin:thioredoxin reductase [Candidatus Lokiarchaeota archaeon]|nr:ferredoxin:thioredoxin reductase [Candidatus Lokiarchaeota archaeon]